MPVRQQYLAYVLEQLAGVSALRSRRMFGGIGLYNGERFFGLIDDDVLYLKVDEANRAEFIARGCRPFQPFKDRPESSMSYYDVPADVLEDVEELAQWARRSIAVAAPPQDRREETTTMNAAMADASAELQEVIDRQKIYDVLARYCRALDRCDLELMKTVYWGDGIDDHVQGGRVARDT